MKPFNDGREVLWVVPMSDMFWVSKVGPRCVSGVSWVCLGCVSGGPQVSTVCLKCISGVSCMSQVSLRCFSSASQVYQVSQVSLRCISGVSKVSL